MAEAMALKDGVDLAVEKKFHNVILETDSKEMQNVLTNKCKVIEWKIRPIVLDIQKQIQLIPGRKVTFVRREANAAANWLAINTRKGMCQPGWLRRLPSVLVEILNKDGLPAPP